MRNYQKCPWSRSGNACLVRRCPLSNKRFTKELDKWALIGRAPKALNPEPSPGGGYDAEWQMLRKARIAMLFEDDQLILDWMNTGNMSGQTCKELVRGERKFRDMIWRERYGQ